MYSSLIDFKKNFGHCNVTRRWQKNLNLATWVNNQRRLKRLGKLSKERISKLTKIGFIWEVNTSLWEEMFLELTNFKKVYGNCNVPAKWEENPKLGNWVSKQRQCKRKKLLSQERVRRLEELGFQWK